MGSKPELAGLFLCFCRLEAYCRLSKVQGTPFSRSFLLIPFVAEPKQLPEKWTSYEFHGRDFRLLCYRRWRGKEWRLLQPLFCTGFSVVTCLPSIPPPPRAVHSTWAIVRVTQSAHCIWKQGEKEKHRHPFLLCASEAEGLKRNRVALEFLHHLQVCEAWNVHPLA